MSAKLVRRTKVLELLKTGQSNASVVVSLMSEFPGVSEQTAKQDVVAVLERLSQIESDTQSLQETKQKFLEIGWSLLAEARAAGQYGPAVAQYKVLAAMSGLAVGQTGPALPGGSMVADGLTAVATIALRQRVAQLLKDPALRAAAQHAGLALPESTEDSD